MKTKLSSKTTGSKQSLPSYVTHPSFPSKKKKKKEEACNTKDKKKVNIHVQRREWIQNLNS